MSAETNSIKDEIREEQKKFRDMSFKEKEKYIWDYYRMKIFVSVCVIFFLVLFTVQFLEAQRPKAIFVIYANSKSSFYIEDKSYEQGFADYLGIDTNKTICKFDYDCTFTQNGYDLTTVANLDKLKAYTENGELDIIIGSESDIVYIAGYGYLSTDITEYLDNDVLNMVNDRLYRYEYSEDTSNNIGEADPFASASENSTDISDNTNTAILAIDITGVEAFEKAGLWEHEDERHLLTIIPTSDNSQNINAFLRYMFEIN